MLKVELIGNLGKDAEAKEINGNKFIEFSLGCTTGKNQTTWVRCSMFGERPNLMPYLKKGAKYYVTGDLIANAYVNQQGQPTVSLDCRVRHFAIISTPQQPQQQTAAPKQVQQQAPQQAPQNLVGASYAQPTTPMPPVPPTTQGEDALPF